MCIRCAWSRTRLSAHLVARPQTRRAENSALPSARGCAGSRPLHMPTYRLPAASVCSNASAAGPVMDSNDIACALLCAAMPEGQPHGYQMQPALLSASARKPPRCIVGRSRVSDGMPSIHECSAPATPQSPQAKQDGCYLGTCWLLKRARLAITYIIQPKPGLVNGAAAPVTEMLRNFRLIDTNSCLVKARCSGSGPAAIAPSRFVC